jgi:hypothetical protein
MQFLQSFVAVLGVLCVAGSAAADTTTSGNGVVVPDGSMHQVTTGPSYIVDLMNAMTNRTNYASSVGRPICVVEVKKVSLSMGTGVNYQFEVNGCSQTFSDKLGQCGDTACVAPSLWQINVFVQPWSNTYRVDSILFLQ